jgi:hypothetical protein
MTARAAFCATLTRNIKPFIGMNNDGMKGVNPDWFIPVINP